MKNSLKKSVKNYFKLLLITIMIVSILPL